MKMLYRISSASAAVTAVGVLVTLSGAGVKFGW
jgi:hypothetical protein